jgi:hypothetical protein
MEWIFSPRLRQKYENRPHWLIFLRKISLNRTFTVKKVANVQISVVAFGQNTIFLAFAGKNIILAERYELKFI